LANFLDLHLQEGLKIKETIFVEENYLFICEMVHHFFDYSHY